MGRKYGALAKHLHYQAEYLRAVRVAIIYSALTYKCNKLGLFEPSSCIYTGVSKSAIFLARFLNPAMIVEKSLKSGILINIVRF